MTPLSDRRWPQKPSGHEVSLLLAAAASDHWTDGPFTAEVERKMEGLTGAPHAVAFNSCTSALHAALIAMGCAATTRLAVPVLTFVGTVTGAVHIGARLTAADVAPDTLTMTTVPDGATMVIAVDLHGVPHTLDRSAAAGRPILTDACQSLGTRIGGRHIGSQGTHAWSFSSAKMVTAPDGGAVTTDDPALADRLREIRDYGIKAQPGQPRANGVVVFPGGHNWRPSELSMALVSHRLTTLGDWVDRAAQVTERLHAAADEAGLWRQQAPVGTQPAWHKVRIGPNSWSPVLASALERDLNEAGIPTHRWGTTPLHKHPAYSFDQPEPVPMAQLAAAGTFCLGTEACPPMTWTDYEVARVARTLTEIGTRLVR